jgi:hypothetical protein
MWYRTPVAEQMRSGRQPQSTNLPQPPVQLVPTRENAASPYFRLAKSTTYNHKTLEPKPDIEPTPSGDQCAVVSACRGAAGLEQN